MIEVFQENMEVLLMKDDKKDNYKKKFGFKDIYDKSRLWFEERLFVEL